MSQESSPVREGCWIVGRSKYHSVSLWRFFLWLGSKRRERRERRMMRLSGKENSLPALVHPRFPWTRIIDLFAVDVCFRDGACSNGTRSSPNLLLSFVEGDNKKKKEKEIIESNSSLFLFRVPSSNNSF